MAKKQSATLTTQLPVPVEMIERRIYLIRGHKVMLDSHLAELYGVTTKRLNEQVKRNRNRFPEDFMFQLTREETTLLNRSQIATGSWSLDIYESRIGIAQQIFRDVVVQDLRDRRFVNGHQVLAE